ncbi:histidine phosphatase family protein [Bradyrhizobium sp. ORS 111]|uniref:histidine phosphatase family protein n=1 Tax=Bradyrhizobium sp. ORS 111 TaxID=1685958 RepID=UPI00388FE0E7
MATTVHLVRHGHHGLLEQLLCGRLIGISIDTLGREQMARCAERMHPMPDAIRSSPQQRAKQSADILGDAFGLAVQLFNEVDEIDYGGWTGRSFADLHDNHDWLRWNEQRAYCRPPGGESMEELQRRVVGGLRRLEREQGAATIAVVTHAEPIRAAILYCAGVPLDRYSLIDVGLASISTLSIEHGRLAAVCVNQEVPT